MDELKLDADSPAASPIRDPDALRSQFGTIGSLAAHKVLDRLDDDARRFIALAQVLVPGINETLRVNGTGAMTQDAALLEPLAAQGKVPTAGLIVHVREVYFQCGKAMIRSGLWDPARHVERSAFPSLGRILADQTAAATVPDAEATIADADRTRLYRPIPAAEGLYGVPASAEPVGRPTRSQSTVPRVRLSISAVAESSTVVARA